MEEQRLKIYLTGLAFALLSVTIIGLFYLAITPLTQNIALGFSYPVWLVIAFIAGLSMIFLPCTLPLVFIIVPLSMGKGYKKGLFTALSFGIGLMITLTFYGVFVSFMGQYLGLDKATQIMFVLAGFAALIFGLGELRLIKFQMPSFNIATPKIIQERKGYIKTFLLGLFLGNAGIGCPNPAFYWLLIYIAGTGSALIGGSLGLIHGIGRFIPLLFLAVLGILGVNLTQKIAQKSSAVEKWTGIGLIVAGAFILQIGLFGMYFWESSIFHQAWNAFVAGIAPNISEAVAGEAIAGSGVALEPSTIEKYFPGLPWLFMVLMMAIPLLWWKYKKKGENQ